MQIVEFRFDQFPSILGKARGSLDNIIRLVNI